MKESYRKGVANHPDPEPCEGVLQGRTRSVGTKDQAEPPQRGAPKPGQGHMQAGYPEVVSSEIAKDRCADGVRQTGRQHCGVRENASTQQALRSRRPHACMETSRARTERPGRCPNRNSGGPVGESDER